MTATKQLRAGRVTVAALLTMVTATLVTAGHAVAETPGEPLTVEQAVALALQNNRRIAVAALGVDRAEQRVAAARTNRLPSLSVQALAGTTLDTVSMTFPAGAFGRYPGIGPIPSSDALVQSPRAVSGTVDATLAQPLTQLFRIGLGTRLSEIGRDIEKEKLRQERSAIAGDVRRRYYGLLQAESAVVAAETRVRVYRELTRVVGEQVKIEAALRGDGLEVRSRLASEEQQFVQLRNDLADGREQLNFLLGRELDHDVTLVAVPEASEDEAELSSAVARAVRERPDLAQARLQVEQADTDRRMKKAEAIPDLSLAVTYLTFVNVDLLPRNVAQAGLQLKWEPFDWGRRGKQTAEKALQVVQARRALQEAEARARLEVGHAFRKLEEARMLVAAARLGHEAAQERLRVTATRQRVDAALIKDVLESQASESAANVQYERALSTFWTAKADFRSALGEE
jgi:outer membrane protein TolC